MKQQVLNAFEKKVFFKKSSKKYFQTSESQCTKSTHVKVILKIIIWLNIECTKKIFESDVNLV